MPVYTSTSKDQKKVTPTIMPTSPSSAKPVTSTAPKPAPAPAKKPSGVGGWLQRQAEDLGGALGQMGSQFGNSIGTMFSGSPSPQRYSVTPGVAPFIQGVNMYGAATASPAAARWNELPDAYKGFVPQPGYSGGANSFYSQGGANLTGANKPNVPSNTYQSDWDAQQLQTLIDAQEGQRQKSFMDWLMGNDIQAPQLNLPSPAALPDVNFSDLLAPYQGAITSANDMVQNAISQSASQNAAANEALRGRLAGNYADSANVYNRASEGGQANLGAIANRLGIDQAMAGPSQDAWAQQDARIKGLLGAQQAGSLSSLDTLANAKTGAFDVAKNLAAGFGAQNLSGLANTLSNAEIQEELQRRQNSNDLAMNQLNAQLTMAQLGADMSDKERSRRFNILQLMNTLQNQAGAESGNVTQETTSTNPNLMADLNTIQDPKVKQIALDAYMPSGGDVNKAIANLYNSQNQPGFAPGMQPNLSGLSGIFSGIPQALKNVNKPSPYVQQAIELLQQYAPAYGGTTQKTTTTGKVKSNTAL